MIRAALTLALATAALADPASEVLDAVEAHCIQPGRPFSAREPLPPGWTAMAPEALLEGVEMALLEIAVRAGLTAQPGATPEAVWTAAAEDLASVRRYRLEALEDGELTGARHPSGARLLMEARPGRWLHGDCILWHPDPDDALHDQILARWTRPVPGLGTGPLGTAQTIRLTIWRNETVAELAATVVQPGPEAAPVRTVLLFTLLAP